MKRNTEQKLFISDTFLQCSSTKCHREFHTKHCDSTVLHKATINSINTKLCSMGSVQDKMKFQKRYVLFQEKFDNTGTQIRSKPKDVTTSFGFSVWVGRMYS
jgi:hypothetical protein